MSDAARQRVVDEAKTWLGTPYHHMGRLKGAGTDCLMLLAEVYHAAGVIPRLEVGFYAPDWHLHRDAERYLEGVMHYAREVEQPQPGDVAVFRFGRCFAHGAIVTLWPRLIHAWHSAGVIEAQATQPQLASRPVRFFDPF